MLGATRTPLFSILKSQAVNNTRAGNKANMGGILSIYAHDFADGKFNSPGSRVLHMLIAKLLRVFRSFLWFWFLQRYTREFAHLNHF